MSAVANDRMYLVRGSSLRYVVEYKDVDGNLVDISGLTFTSTIRSSQRSSDKLIDLTTTVDTSNSIVTLSAPPADTLKLPLKVVWFDVMSVDQAGVVSYTEAVKIEVSEQITRT